jgi:hypothetical protein
VRYVSFVACLLLWIPDHFHSALHLLLAQKRSRILRQEKRSFYIVEPASQYEGWLQDILNADLEV